MGEKREPVEFRHVQGGQDRQKGEAGAGQLAPPFTGQQHIELVAQGMEKIDAVAVSAELDLSGYQGYASGRPEQLPQA